MSNKPDYHTLSDSAMISTKHLDNLPAWQGKRTIPHGMNKSGQFLDSIKGYEGYITSEQWRTSSTPYIRYNPLTGGYEWVNPHVKPIPHYPHPTDLWQAMFGKPRHDVWNRFARAFHYWAPEFIKLGRRLNTIHSYWVMDWLTNVFTPRINQYDPVNYIEYCEKHLQYTALHKFGWESDFAKFNMDPLWWSSSIVDPFKNDPYKIDDTCKQTLAQMFPVKFLVNKRII